MSAEQVNNAFQEALKLTSEACTTLPEVCVSPHLLIELFHRLLECEKEKEQSK